MAIALMKSIRDAARKFCIEGENALERLAAFVMIWLVVGD